MMSGGSVSAGPFQDDWEGSYTYYNSSLSFSDNDAGSLFVNERQ